MYFISIWVISLNSQSAAELHPCLPVGLQDGGCPSPDLPLPPPPPPLDSQMSELVDEPLPPPPPDLTSDPALRCWSRDTGTNADVTSSSDDLHRNPSVYPKNSYMSYVSGRKASRRHGYEGNYRRSQNLSPPSRELDSLPHLTSVHPQQSVSGQPSSLPGQHTQAAAFPLPSNALFPLQGNTTQFPASFQNDVPSYKTHSNGCLPLQLLSNQNLSTPSLPSNPPSVSVPIEPDESALCDRVGAEERSELTTTCELSKVARTNFPENVHRHDSFQSSCLKSTDLPELVTPLQDMNARTVDLDRSCLHPQMAKSRESVSRESPPKSSEAPEASSSLTACHQSLKSEQRYAHTQLVKSQDSPPTAKPRDSYVLLPIDIGENHVPELVVCKGREPSQPDTILPSSPTSVASSSSSSTSSPEVTYKKLEDVEAVMSLKEDEHERLSKAFADRCGDHTLRSILVPGPDRAQLWDYLEGVFTKEDLLLRHSRPLKQQQAPTSPNNNSHNENNTLSNREPSGVVSHPATGSNKTGELLPAHSAYFTTSEPKAKLLTRISQTDLLLINGRSSCASDSELGRKKEELISSIGRKLSLLRGEQLALQEEVTQNEALGRQVADRVEQVAKVNELQKFRLHVEETEKIVNLLMSLSGRLARAQNALRALPQDAPADERHLLEAKRDKLSSQHEEARSLKESVDRRGRQVADFLRSYLGEEDFGDFVHFVAMKAKLLVDARELDDKIRLGEEQLAALERKRQHEAMTGGLYRQYDGDWNSQRRTSGSSNNNNGGNTGATSV